MQEKWAPIITVIGSNLIIILSFFGMSINLHNSLQVQVTAIHQEIRQEVQAIQLEMKDFHQRLYEIRKEEK